MDERGIRWSHPEPTRVGERVSTDPSQALAGHEVRHIDNGTLGRSARGKVPLYDTEGELVGAVSVGILLRDLGGFQRHRAVLAVGFVLAILGAGFL